MNSKQRFNKKRMAAFNARKAAEVDTKRRSKIGAADVLALLVIQFRDTTQRDSGAMCLPEVAMFNAGHRKTRKDAVHIIK
ncbi:hypothetical protein ACN09C_14795 [Serratia fonticola]|uniref:transcriptional antitermination N peptide n=1 Tax=Serratia fonticola TaxID=47917 RepID=UPI003B0043F8